MGKTTAERFWEKVDKNGPVPPHRPNLGPCWLWTGGKRNKGYGAFAYRRGGVLIQDRAHRYSYALHIGPIPGGLWVLHYCDVTACVRPSHLFTGSSQQNVDDMMAKGRHVKGGTYRPGNYERGLTHHNARLTDEEVRVIRRKYESGTTSYGKLAAEYGLAISYVFRVVKRTARRDIE